MDLISCKHCKRKIERDFEICPFCLGNLKVEKMDTAFCRFCGKEIKKGYRNCPHCGNELIKNPVNVAAPVADETVLFSAVNTMPASDETVLFSAVNNIPASDETVLFSAANNTPVAEPAVVQSAPIQSAPMAESAPLLCPTCGFECKSTSKFCKNCGTKLQ